MNINIITISREFGSGGRTIGKELASKLGIPCYDSEIIESVAQKSGFAKKYIAEKGEDLSSTPFSGIFRGSYNSKNSDEELIWKLQSQTIVELSEQGPCVIVGRCADYILRYRDDMLKVFVHASPEFRADRIVNVYGESDNLPEKRIKEKDKRRASYYQFYTERKFGDVRNYDVCFDSEKLGIEKCADILFEICNNK